MRRRAGFTLIELLVVIAVITILLAILLPSLRRAREAANRAACASNLHNLGLACHNFANTHNGRFPASYRMPASGYSYRFPLAITRDIKMDETTTKWTTYGSSWASFEENGATEKTFVCPSAITELRYLDPSTGTPAMWGQIVWTNYAYVAGLTANNYGRSIVRWGTAIPAVKSSDRAGAQKVIAADMVFFTGGGAYIWDWVQERYAINHRSRDASRPAFQNVLYADGHVAGLGPEHWRFPLNTTNNFSLQHAKSPIGGFIYWCPMQAGTVTGKIPSTPAATTTTPAAPAPLPLPIP
jgi:prepilin-type N-terminal cleavage/methylation domain-containing protein